MSFVSPVPSRERSRPSRGRGRLAWLAILAVVLGVASGFVHFSGGLGRAADGLVAVIGRPTAATDAVTVSQDVRGQPVLVLANDTDPNGDPLEIVGASSRDGTLTVYGDQLRYTPPPGFVGVAYGTYTVRDPGGGLASATVRINVVPNAYPMPVPDTIALPSGTGTIDVLANDVDPDNPELTLVAVAESGGGTATIQDGLISYTAHPEFTGIDRLYYSIADSAGLESVGYVDVSIPAATCTGADDASLDEDADRFDNADEIANGTDPCDPASVPADADADGTSDLADAFHLDPADGLATMFPVELTFDAPVPGTVMETGFTGVMQNGAPPMDLVDPAAIQLGDGTLTIATRSPGDAFRETNTQRNALQLGVRLPLEPFTVHGRLHLPFAAPGYQSAGIYVGSGDQDNYVKLAVSVGDGEGGVRATYEVDGDGRGAALRRDPRIIGENVQVDLYIRIDPLTGRSESSYAINEGGRIGLGASAHLQIPQEWAGVLRALAVGIVITPESRAPQYSGTWELFEVTLDEE